MGLSRTIHFGAGSMNRRNNGSVTVETLLIVPALFAFTSLIVYVGRMTEAAVTVRHASDVAARVASQSNADTARQRAMQAAKQELGSANSGCAKSEVLVRRTTNSTQMTFSVTVNCVLDTRGLGVLAVAPLTITADSSEVIDVYTAR